VNETSPHNGGPDPTFIPPDTIAPRAARLSGLQAAVAIFDAQLTALRSVLGPREWVVLLDLLRRRLGRELEREARGLRRWAA
jgi:hypothetical protein